MNVGGLAKGALIGALVGGAFNGMRQFTGKKNERTPLPARHDNISALDEELLVLLQELDEMALVPAHAKAEHRKHFVTAINYLERLAVIEVQIEKQEIVPGFRDANDARRLGHLAVQELRASEQLFEQIELRMQFRDKVTELQTSVGMHLNNINSECLQY